MLSRVAERMYWAGRYLERVESTARLVSVHSTLLLDLPAASGIGWEQLLVIADARESFDQRYTTTSEHNVLTYLLANQDNPSSLVASLTFARENMRTSREIVPEEAWECVNELYLLCKKDIRSAVKSRHRFETLAEYIEGCQRISGLLFGTMSHGDAYNFLRIGAYVERADMTARVVDVAAATLAGNDADLEPYANTLWMGVLMSVSGYQMYRQYVRRRIAGEDVVRFLLADAQFPHAVNCTLTELGTHLARLPQHLDASAVIADLKQQLQAFTLESRSTAELHDFIDVIERGLNELHQRIDKLWFLKQLS